MTEPRPFELSAADPTDIRNAGWSVAVHNDYRLNKVPHTFWLFTKGDRNVKGEGLTDADALNEVRKQINLSIPARPCDFVSNVEEPLRHLTVRGWIAAEALLPGVDVVLPDTAYIQHIDDDKVLLWLIENGQWVSKSVKPEQIETPELLQTSIIDVRTAPRLETVPLLMTLPGPKELKKHMIPLDLQTRLQVASILLENGTKKQKKEAADFISELFDRK